MRWRPRFTRARAILHGDAELFSQDRWGAFSDEELEVLLEKLVLDECGYVDTPEEEPASTLVTELRTEIEARALAARHRGEVGPAPGSSEWWRARGGGS